MKNNHVKLANGQLKLTLGWPRIFLKIANNN